MDNEFLKEVIEERCKEMVVQFWPNNASLIDGVLTFQSDREKFMIEVKMIPMAAD